MISKDRIRGRPDNAAATNSILVVTSWLRTRRDPDNWIQQPPLTERNSPRGDEWGLMTYSTTKRNKPLLMNYNKIKTEAAAGMMRCRTRAPCSTLYLNQTYWGPPHLRAIPRNESRTKILITSSQKVRGLRNTGRNHSRIHKHPKSTGRCSLETCKSSRTENLSNLTRIRADREK